MNLKRLELPESLKTKLRAFEHRLYRAETLAAVSGGLCGLVVSWLVLFLSDRVWDTPALLRVAITLVGVVACAAFVRFWVRNWLTRRRDVFKLSRLIQRKYPFLGDRLLGIVELSDVSRRTPDISPELCRAAIEQVSSEAEPVAFEKAIDERRPRRLAAVLAGCAVLVLAFAALVPGAALNAFKRWLKPFSPVERYTLVTLQGLPDRMAVPHGEPFDLAFSVAPGSRWHPDAATIQCGDQPRQRVEFVADHAAARIDGQTRDVDLVVRAGDFSHTVRVEPVYRSTLRKLTALVTLPEYLGYPEQALDVPARTVRLLEGSSFRLRGEVTRDLAAATIDFGQSVPLTVEGASFITEPFSCRRFDACSLRWEDALGLSARDTVKLSIVVEKDDSPFVDCPDMSSAVAILQDETLKINTLAQDDYGVKRLWADTQIVKAANDSLVGTKASYAIRDGGQRIRDVRGVFTFSPAMMGVPPESVVSVRAAALDYLPGRKPAYSAEYLVYVLSWAQHAQLVRERFEMLQTRLGEVVRREEELLAGNENIQKLPDKDLKAEETTEQIKDQEHGESANRADLERLVREGAELMKEALRNKEISTKALKEMADSLGTMQDVADQELQQAEEALQGARQQQESRRQKMTEAVRRQREALEKLRKTQENMSETLDNMMAQNFVNRLRAAAKAETEIGTGLKAIIARTAGAVLSALPADLRKAVIGLSQQHDGVRRQAQYIKDDLQGFFTRTRIEKYKTVEEDMDKVKMAESLEALTATIGENRGFTGIAQTAHWAAQFNRWADLLEQQDNQRAPEDQPPSDQPPPDLALLMDILRLVMGESELREKTRFLDERITLDMQYAKKADGLGDEQQALFKQLKDVQTRAPYPQVKQLLGRAGSIMNEAEAMLRKPQTNQTTVAAETEVIELLSGALNQAAQQMQGGGGGAGMMSMLMQMMMGGGAGQTPGGSTAGGITRERNTPVGGPAAEGRGPERTGKRGAGQSLDQVPAEYREAMEAYFKKIEGGR